MISKHLFAFTAFFTLLLGLAWMILPESLLTAWGIVSSPAPVYMSRRYPIPFVGNAVLLWLARNEEQSQACRAILAEVLSA